MKNRAVRLMVTLTVLLCLLIGFSIPASAEIPYESYTYWSDVDTDRKAVYNKAMYDLFSVIDSSDCNNLTFDKINDVCTDSDNNVYILDNQSKIIILGNDYKFLRSFGSVGDETFAEAQGIYVHTDGTIYICDTQNHRVLHCNDNGELLKIIGLPDSPLIPDDFDFLPISITVDSLGYSYILSDGSYYGALLYDPQYEFLGFYGPNKIKSGITGAIKTITDRVFSNSSKKSASARALPYCFVDIVIDNKDFIYTATGNTSDKTAKGQIRKLSPGKGANILDSDEVNFVDEGFNHSFVDGDVYLQDILSIEVDKNGLIYALDSSYGRILVYDSDCRMITAFGGGMGYGSQDGTFQTPVSIALCGKDVLVADSSKNTVTVFRPNSYGLRVQELLNLTIKGKHSQAKQGWEDILKIDANLQIAYSGLARSFYKEGNYKKAMEMAKTGYDRETYGLAYEAYRQNLIDKNFGVVFAVIILIIALIVTLLIIGKYKKIVLIKNPEVELMLTTMIHPSKNFTEIDEKNKGSVLLGGILVVVYYISTVLKDLMGGFLFTMYDPASYNSLLVLIRSVGLVVLWIISNWMISTLLGGKGKIKQITIVTCYSLIPLIVSGFINVILTNILLPTEASFLGIIEVIAIIYALLMLIIGLMKIHDFSLPRFIGTSILSLACMAIIVFLISLIIILVQQLGGFILTVIIELFM